MKKPQTRDFLIRNIPIEVYHLLEESAKDHHRSKTQEAIVLLTSALSKYGHRVQQPTPFKWKRKISNKFILEAIEEDRE